MTRSSRRAPTSLVDVFVEHLGDAPWKRAIAFLDDRGRETAVLTFEELFRRASTVAAELGSRGYQGERAVLLYPPGLEFVTAFVGCLMAGVAAVPAYPPRGARNERLHAVLRDAEPVAVLTEGRIAARAGVLEAEAGLAPVVWIDTASLPDAPARVPAPPSGEETAFVQYTSGSTSAPKGVAVSHANLLANERAIQAAFRTGGDDLVVGWLPPYHDMGLIGNILHPLFLGIGCVLMSPMTFLRRPLRWLEAVSRYRATVSGGPNFAYELCIEGLARAGDAAPGLDLGAWRVAFNGAEPVRADTLERFAGATVRFGFRREALFPCYGLAEATLIVSGWKPEGGSYREQELLADRLEQGVAEAPGAGEGDPDRTVRLVGSGAPAEACEVAIVDPESLLEVGAGRIGEIWVAGPSVAAGYLGRSESGETFGATLATRPGRRYLRTGDLGFSSRGELFVTGRLKDLIIIRGRNLYPQDIELAVARSHDALCPGGGAAFEVEVEGEARLAVAHEVDRRFDGDLAEVAAAARREVSEAFEVDLFRLELIPQGRLPKTTSGKIRRRECRRLMLEGVLPIRYTSARDEPAAVEPRPETWASPADDRLARWKALAAAALRMRPEAFDPDRPLTAYGLDSLSAIELESRCAAAGVEVDAARWLAGFTVAELARLAEAAPAPATARPPAESETEADLPLTYGQRGIWFLHRLAPQSSAYNIAAAGRVRGALDRRRLRWAVGRLVARHPSLRTRYRAAGEGVVHSIARRVVTPLLVLDARGLSAASADRLVCAAADRAFDLEKTPPLRVTLIERPGGEHLLVFAVHHIAADFRSMEQLAGELRQLYRDGPEARLPPAAPLDMGSVALEEAAFLASDRSSGHLVYWTERLAGDPPELELPTDRPRPQTDGFEGGEVSAAVDGPVAEGVARLAAECGTTPFAVLLAALKALLSRYSGQRDLLVGTPTTARSLPGTERLVGYLVNPLPLRSRWDGDLSFAALVAIVSRTLGEALAHRSIPFTLLAERIAPERRARRSAFFRVMLVHHQPRDREGADLGAFALRRPGGRLHLGAVEVESIRLPQTTAQLDLTVTVAALKEGLLLRFQYSADLFDRSTVARMAGHFSTLLAAAIGRPASAIGGLPLLTASERAHLAREWSSVAPIGSPASTLHRAIEIRARELPDRTALAVDDRRLSYAELDRRAELLADELAARGIGLEAPVAVCARRSIDLPVALLAVLKAGAAYVPLDPAYPIERTGLVLSDSCAAAVIADDAGRRCLPASGPPVVSLDRSWQGGPVGRRRAKPSPENLAYVIYTSGSTGAPKGVAIRHGAAAALLDWAGRTFARSELEGVLAATSVCFDLSIFELFAPLAAGGTVLLAEDVLALAEHPAAAAVTLVNTTPSGAAELDRMGGIPGSIRVVNLAGEPFPRPLADRLWSHGGVRRVLNLYGPSEDTTYSTAAEVACSDRRQPSIGRPLPGGYAYVVDAGMRLLPMGAQGELLLGGAGLARGYLRRPARTARSFVPDPFAAVPGGRLYRTGDRVRFRADGELEFIGRFDHQIKLRGFRIELGEIESALLARAEVREAVVVVHGGGSEGRLVAYWVPEAEAASSEDLRLALARRLPAFMVPSTLVRLEELPRTPNGKIDREALPAPGRDRSRGGRSFVEPHGPIEQAVAEIFGSLLGAGAVAADDDFFSLGGHSLLAARLTTRLTATLGAEVPLSAVFAAPTVAALAARIEAGGEPSAREAIRAVPRSGPLALSPPQERLWFLARLEPESAAYNVPFSLRLEGKLSVRALGRSLDRIVERHEALRTRFPEIGEGRPVQRIADRARLGLPIVDLSGIAGQRRRSAAAGLTVRLAAAPFAVETGLLVRVVLLRLGTHHELVGALHHLVADGWSLGVLVRELESLYPALLRGESPRLPELPIQYADYAADQREALAEGRWADQAAYWHEQLAGLPPEIELAADRPRPAVRSSAGGTVDLWLPAPLLAGLNELAGRRGLTLFMLLFAGYCALLHRLTGERDLPIGTPVANRNRLEVEGLIGCFINTLVLRARPDLSMRFSELAGEVRETCLAAYDHREHPFEALVEELQLERSLSRSPVFQVMLALQNVPRLELRLPGLRLAGKAVRIGIAKFDLTVVFEPREDGLGGYLEYSSDIFDRVTVQRLERRLRAVLEEVVAAPDRVLGEIGLQTAPERHQLLREWNDSGLDPIPPGCVEAWIDAQAARTPDATAASDGRRWLSYGELRRRSLFLARRLRGLGVGGGGLVVLALERDADFLVAMLAVFRAGAAYVPFEVGQPVGRWKTLMEQCRPTAAIGARAARERLAEAIGALPRGDAPRWLSVDEEGGPEAGRRVPGAERDGLAYVLFTSGSTGQPKGAMVTHAGMCNHLLAKLQELSIGPDDRVAQTAAVTFDISVWQFLAPLAAGGRVVIYDDDLVRSPPRLIAAMRRDRISIYETVPSLLGFLLDELEETGRGEGLSPALRWLIPTGEALPREQVRRWHRLFPAIPLLNAYGPTECSDDVTHQRLWGVAPAHGDAIPIGRPVANLRLFVLDRRVVPMPLGSPGELCVGGAGVGRGYLGRPARTAESFVPDPFSPAPGSRLYRTGDRGRHLKDGGIEFLGRLDLQVKIRGFRVEPGEIEAVLEGHPAVSQAAVVARPGPTGDSALVAYVAPAGPDERSPSRDGESVAAWREIFDEVYRSRELSSRDDAVNLRVWVSSYTGRPLSEEEIFECVENTVARVLTLSPRRVLEIGCGTGLILLRVAPHCEGYTGTDISPTALETLRRRADRSADRLPPVRLIERSAEDLRGIQEGGCDTVVLNEVVQYFPSLEYLVQVLETAVRAVGRRGRIFVGGVRSQPLLTAFHASVELHGAPDAMSVADLSSRIARAAARDKELAVSPELFRCFAAAHPRIGAVSLELKGGASRNELTAFRYDVVLHVGESALSPPPAEWLDWTEETLTLDAIARRLQAGAGDPLAVGRIPNARVASELGALELLATMPPSATVAELRERLAGAADPEAVDPGCLWPLAERCGYRAEVRWRGDGTTGSFDAIFRRRVGDHGPPPTALSAGEATSDWSGLANRPFRDSGGAELTAVLSAFLSERLPAYMVPASFVILDRLPLAASGKLDRKALPAPESFLEPGSAGYVAPRSPAEESLARIWAEVLGVARVGVRENFFALGGHSLLATRVSARVGKALGVDLAVRDLFEAPTVEALAARVEERLDRGAPPPAPTIVPGRREGASPLSFAQERLWFLEQLSPGTTEYNLVGAVRMKGALELERLTWALNAIEERHASLRTRFAAVDGEPVQIVDPPSRRSLPVADLTALGPRSRELSDELLARAARRPFDLERGPLSRRLLLRTAERSSMLLFGLHHIVGDGWSLGVIVRELAAIYRASGEGRPSEPALPEVSYADFAVWQRQWLQGEVLERRLGYWTRQLEGSPAVLELPGDRPRGSVADPTGGRLGLPLGPELGAAARGLACRRSCSLFMVLLAGFQALLFRHTGQRDLVVGSPVAGRGPLATEGIVGLFVNTIALRVRLAREATFAELLEQVREVSLAAFEHGDAPFEKVVEALRLERDLSVSPLFQVLFVLQNAPRQRFELPGLDIEELALEVGGSQLDQVWSIEDDGPGLRLWIDYRKRLFDRTTVARLASHFARLLAAAAADPDLPLADLPLLSPAEAHQTAREWPSAPAARTGPALLHELIAAQARCAPDRTALVAGDRRLSYAALDRAAGGLTRRLVRAGARPERPVAILLERSLEQIVAMLAVLKAGAFYVPVTPSLPRRRIALVLAEARAKLVVTREEWSELPAGLGIQTATLGASWARDLARAEPACAAGGGRPAGAGGGQQAAYALFTSGSTGVPKGVVVSHEAILNRLRWTTDELGLGPGDRVLQKTPFVFDASIWEVFSPLLAGGQVVLAEPDGHRDTAYLVREIQRHAITTLQIVPSMLPLLLAEPEVSACRSLRALHCGGEALAADLLGPSERLLGVQVRNLYGPTETAIDAASYQGRSGATGERRQVPLGRPLPGVSVAVLDPGGRPAPIGVFGEIAIGGIGLARGYLGRPAGTAERFVPDPLAARAGARRYLTGDRGRLAADGLLEFAGRLDRQAKIGGVRVEPEEVEAVLSRHPAIAEAAVIVHRPGGAADPGLDRLVAYCALAPGAEIEAAALRSFAAESLPAAMVPAQFVFPAALPRTPGGKLDRRALPAPEPIEAGAEEAPRGALEQVLAAIWSDLLKVERVGRHHDFFDLGGHSLAAIRVVSRIRRAFGVELPVRSLFEAPTVAELARSLAAARSQGAQPEWEPLVALEDRSVLPVSSSQERIWFVHALEPESPAYNLAASVEIHGPLDVAALYRSLVELHRRHEVLRTVFRGDDGEPVRGVVAGPPASLPLIDLAALGRRERPAVAGALAAREARRPFDLSAGPLLRTVMVRLGAVEHTALVTVHHVVCDGWSMGLLAREITAGYRAARSSEARRPAPLAVQYADFAIWQRRRLESGLLDSQLAFWRDLLASSSDRLELPADRPRARPRSSAGASLAIHLDADLSGRLQALARSRSVSLYMLLLAAYATLLHRYSGQSSIRIGSPFAGRLHPETEPLVGCFVNTLVLPADCSGDPPFDGLLARTRRTVLAAHANQEVPFDVLVRALRPGRNPAETPLFSTLFALQDAPFESVELPGLTLRPAATEIRATQFDLSLELEATPRGLAGLFEYSTDLFDRTTLVRLRHHFLRLLEAVAGDPETTLSELAMLAPAERHQLCVEQQGRRPPPDRRHELFHETFEDRAARCADAVAVVDGERHLSYRRLAVLASRLAARLRGLGVVPAERVAVAAERSAETVWSLLGVLEAGAAYLPLDPGDPPDRLGDMSRRAGARFLIGPPVTAARLGLRPVEPMAGTDAAREGDGERQKTPADALAYVLFTSGSTGRPKGVMVGHASLMSTYRCWEESFGLAEVATQHLGMANPTFDVFLGELSRSLLTGSTLVLCPRDALADPPRLDLLLRRHRIEAGDFLPTVLRGLADLADERGSRLPELKLLIGGSDVWQREEFDRVRRLSAPGARVINAYGLTETAIDSSFFESVDGEAAPGTGPAPIGRPYPDSRIYVLDPGGRPVAIGVLAQLYVGGRSLAWGYLGGPASTAERFLPDPFAREAGARMVRTGDLGRRGAAGDIELVGRADTQVKVRGYRIEPAEIEAALASHPAVKLAVVLAIEDGPRSHRLAAFIRAVPAARAEPGELRRFLGARLPEYMVPASFAFLERFPLSPNGKVDRRALAAMAVPAPREEAVYVAPRTAVEEVLAGIWADLLRRESVGVEDDFFALGGHSLLAAQVLSRVRASLRADVPLRSFFTEPTVAALAAEAVRREPSSGQTETIARLLLRIQRMDLKEKKRLLATRGAASAAAARAARMPPEEGPRA